jgi:hypothetical protein
LVPELSTCPSDPTNALFGHQLARAALLSSCSADTPASVNVQSTERFFPRANRPSGEKHIVVFHKPAASPACGLPVLLVDTLGDGVSSNVGGNGRGLPGQN